MKTTVYLDDFIRAFDEREQYANNFTRSGLIRLFEGLEEFEEDTGEEMELDVIAICCDFAEMTMSEIIDAYGYMMDESRLSDDDAMSYVTDWLNNQTWVLGDTNNNTYVFRQF